MPDMSSSHKAIPSFEGLKVSRTVQQQPLVATHPAGARQARFTRQTYQGNALVVTAALSYGTCLLP